MKKHHIPGYLYPSLSTFNILVIEHLQTHLRNEIEICSEQKLDEI